MILVIFGAGASFDSVPSRPPKNYPRESLQSRPPLAAELFLDNELCNNGLGRFPQCHPIIRAASCRARRRSAWTRQTVTFVVPAHAVPRAYQPHAGIQRQHGVPARPPASSGRPHAADGGSGRREEQTPFLPLLGRRLTLQPENYRTDDAEHQAFITRLLESASKNVFSMVVLVEFERIEASRGVNCQKHLRLASR
jgi:hypothetical protein